MKLKLLKYKQKGVIKRKLIDLVKEYQLNQNNECYIEIVSIFENLINKYVNKAEIVNYSYECCIQINKLVFSDINFK